VGNTCNTEQAFVQLLQAITMQEWQQRFCEKLGINYVYTYLTTVGHNVVGGLLCPSSFSIKD